MQLTPAYIESVNFVKTGTGSKSGPTATTSALPVSHVKVLINDDEEVDVDSRSKQDFYVDGVDVINEAAFKCAGCQMVTVHDGVAVGVANLKAEASVEKRMYLCTNCGRFGAK